MNFLPFHTPFMAFVGIAALFASCTKPVPAPPPLQPDTLETVFTFDDPAEASQWQSNFANQMKFAPVEVPGGGHGVKLFYDPKYNWPNYMLDRPKVGGEGAPLVRRFYELLDSGAYDAVTFTLRNDSDTERVMAVNDMTPFKVPAKTTKRFDVAISQLVQRHGQKPQDVTRFALTGVPDQDAFEVTLEDVGFLKRADNAEALRAGVAARAEAFARKQGGDRFAVGVESPMRHVFPGTERYEPRFESSYGMKAARNESESFQAVVVPFAGPLEEITWEITDPVDPAGNKLQTSVRVVGYVEAGPVLYALNATGGWYPDLLLDAKSVPRLEPGTNLALWVKTRVPESADPGLYKGSLTVRAKNAQPQTVEFSVEVLPFTLPQTPSLKQSYRINTTGQDHGLAKIYPPEKVDEMLYQAEQLVLGEYKQEKIHETN